MDDSSADSFSYTKSQAIADKILIRYLPGTLPELGNCMSCCRIGRYDFECCKHDTVITIFVPNHNAGRYLFFNPTLVAAAVGHRDSQAFTSYRYPLVIPDDETHTKELIMPVFGENYEFTVRTKSGEIVLEALRLIARGQWDCVNRQMVVALKGLIAML